MTFIPYTEKAHVLIGNYYLRTVMVSVKRDIEREFRFKRDRAMVREERERVRFKRDRAMGPPKQNAVKDLRHLYVKSRDSLNLKMRYLRYECKTTMALEALCTIDSFDSFIHSFDSFIQA